MKRIFTLCLSALLMTGHSLAQNADMTLNVDMASRGAEVPASMYGIFFEEINHAGDGGLYAEMLMNRSFEERVMPEGYKVMNGELVPPDVKNHLTGKSTPGRYRWGTDPYPGWELRKIGEAEAEATLVTEQPNFATAPTSMKIHISRMGNGVALINKGYWGIALKQGESYKLRMFVRCTAGEGNMKVNLTDGGSRTLGGKSFKLKADGKWHEYKATLKSTTTISTAQLAISLPAEGTYFFDYVSLFPKDTYKGRPNGMRKDVAAMIEGLQPAFIRWPGGCIVEGITLNNRVEWKKTLGDPASRQGQYDTWGYHNTYGFGYKEFLDFCEDTGAKGMYVCNVGIGCQARTGEACSDKEAEEYLQDALDAIEYAIGPTDSQWGARRAADGHPKPYPLAYVEIGNENSGPLYDRRFNMFYDAIKARYPQLTLISNHGLGGIGGARKTDMVDPHWYVAPEFFFKNAGIFDNHERGKYKVYVGEYACNQGVGGGNMLAALSEAAFITGMERNSDLVTMASYAPLFENRNDRAWPTNLIWMSNDAVVGRSSYYVQKMFAENRPSYNLNTDFTATAEEVEPFIEQEGYVGFGTWSTQTRFRNLTITDPQGNTVKADMTDPSQWATGLGSWRQKDGEYAQTGTENRTSLIWKNGKAGKGSVIEFEVNKTSGAEGFLFYFGLTDPSLKKGWMLNVGGWGNVETAIENLFDNNSTVASARIKDSLDSGQWHKVRIVITDHGADYYMDGRLTLSHKNEPLKRKFCIAGYDSNSDEIIVKVVNASDRRCTTRINLLNGDVEPEGRVITLSAESKRDENSFEQPFRISPVESTFGGFARSFSYDFKPNSLTILRIKKK